MCGCKKESDPTDGTPVGKISVSISDVRTKRTSVTLTLRAQGVSLSDYESWGVTFSETSDRDQGLEVGASGTPSAGSVGQGKTQGTLDCSL